MTKLDNVPTQHGQRISLDTGPKGTGSAKRDLTAKVLEIIHPHISSFPDAVYAARRIVEICRPDLADEDEAY